MSQQLMDTSLARQFDRLPPSAIDAEMFNDTVGEHMIVFAKIEPFLGELRAMWDEPKAFYHLEKVILDRPNGAEKLKKTQDWLKSMAEQMAGGQANEASA